ncbi:rhomboid family intramembrane serine protease [Patescibacteria group bacterium]|nr:rhomboid family intramembrane serine protease [Patescibacteria group bacterium]MBU1868727.1 rhomboid family intramembrane serine protease [Patescibacteria group bacterium]
MIPIRDHNPSGKTPWVTYFLIAANCIVFLYMVLLPEDSLEQFIYSYAVIPRQLLQGQKVLSLLSAMFLHGSFGHIIGNMLFLNIFGDNLEDVLGHFKFILFYLLCGLGAWALQLLITPASEIPMLGASGAIAGVMGGYLVLFPNNKIDILFTLGWYISRVSLPAYTMLFYWFFAQLLYGVGGLGFADVGGVAYFAHIGGFAAGWVLISLLGRKKGRNQRGDLFFPGL